MLIWRLKQFLLAILICFVHTFPMWFDCKSSVCVKTYSLKWGSKGASASTDLYRLNLILNCSYSNILSQRRYWTEWSSVSTGLDIVKLLQIFRNVSPGDVIDISNTLTRFITNSGVLYQVMVKNFCLSKSMSSGTSSRQPAHCISALFTRRYIALITMVTIAQCIQCLVTSASVGWENTGCFSITFFFQKKRCIMPEDDFSCSLSVVLNCQSSNSLFPQLATLGHVVLPHMLEYTHTFITLNSSI